MTVPPRPDSSEPSDGRGRRRRAGEAQDVLLACAMLLPVVHFLVGNSRLLSVVVASAFAALAAAVRLWLRRGDRDLVAEVDRLVFTDPLTGLANRALFRDRLEQARHRALRAGNHLVVLVIDIDDFRNVTNAFGESRGDAVLCELAGRIRHVMRDSDTVARLGGDEFGVLAEVVDDIDAVSGLVGRVLETVHEPFADERPRAHARSIELSISIGAAVDGGERDVDALLRDAELAMCEAKGNSAAAWSLHRSGMTRAALADLQLAAELARAIDAGAIDVVLQPVMLLPQGRLVGAEALARWDHPVHGPVAPDRFIALAEAHGSIARLGDLVLDNALAAIAMLRAEHPDLELRLGVNLSAQQLRSHAIVERTAELLMRHGIPADWLIYELTESVMLEDADGAIATMQALRSHGVRFAIDDFGTGYSSLVYLRRLPVDIVKIDRDFVAGMCDDAADHDLVAAIVQLGAALHLDVVAEGVETLEQLDALTALGCGFAQGFLFSRPLDIRAFSTRVEQSTVSAAAWDGIAG